MTKTCAKIGGRETLKDGIISKLQRHIVSQRKLLIVIHLFSSRFMTNDYWTLLCYRQTFTCVSEPWGPSLSILHVMNPILQLGHHKLTFNDVYTSVKRKSSPYQEKNFTCKFRHERTTHSIALAPFLHYESMENVLTSKIRYIDNQYRSLLKANLLRGYIQNVNEWGYLEIFYENKI